MGSKGGPLVNFTSLLGESANTMSEKEEIQSEVMRINESIKMGNEPEDISEKVQIVPSLLRYSIIFSLNRLIISEYRVKMEC